MALAACVRGFEFGAHRLDRRGWIRADLLRVNLPQRRMILDFCVQQRLRDGRVVHFAVAVAAVTDHVNHHVAAERVAIIERHLPDAHDGVRIFAVHVENGNRLPLGQRRGKARGMQLRRRRS